MEVNPEVCYLNSENGNYVMYSPLKGQVLEVTPSVIKELQNIKLGKESKLEGNIEKTLLERGFIGEKFPEIDITKFVENETYMPTSVTLMPSWDCSLVCGYCYSHGGENPGELMDVNIAKSAVNFIIKNAKEKKIKKINLGYHGAGEPLMPKNIPWINNLNNYTREKAKENNLKVNISSATNGFLSLKNLEWIVKNLDSVNVSLDGPEDIQNKQRPHKLLGPSYKSVARAINYFEQHKFKYGIRATITEDSVNKMEEILRHFMKISSLKQFHLEPLFECGRCETTGLKAPSSEDFIRNFIKTKELARENNVRLYSSGSDLEKIGFKFCGAAGSNFFITPNGKVTSCLEVSRPTDDMNEIFIIGGFDKEKNEFAFNQNKLSALRKRTVQNVEGCEDCFAKYNCSGDCLAKSCAVSGSLYNSKGNVRCEVNQALLLHEIKQKLKHNGELK
jgi:uncharacterized protein